MAITYNWNISQLDCVPQEDNVTDVVVTIHWRLEGTDGAYSGGVYGTATVKPYEAGEPFIPYDQLTQNIVVGWVEEALGADQVQMYKDSVAKQIADQIDPPIVTPPLPWVQA